MNQKFARAMMSSAPCFLITWPVFSTWIYFRLLQGWFTVFSSVPANSGNLLLCAELNHNFIANALSILKSTGSDSNRQTIRVNLFASATVAFIFPRRSVTWLSHLPGLSSRFWAQRMTALAPCMMSVRRSQLPFLVIDVRA